LEVSSEANLRKEDGTSAVTYSTLVDICSAYEPSLRPIWEGYACLLDAAGAFDAVSDAEHAATVVAVTVCASDDPAARLRHQAFHELDSSVSRALLIAADTWHGYAWCVPDRPA
jgi:hypothetical protein